MRVFHFRVLPTFELVNVCTKRKENINAKEPLTTSAFNFSYDVNMAAFTFLLHLDCTGDICGRETTWSLQSSERSLQKNTSLSEETRTHPIQILFFFYFYLVCLRTGTISKIQKSQGDRRCFVQDLFYQTHLRRYTNTQHRISKIYRRSTHLPKSPAASHGLGASVTPGIGMKVAATSVRSMLGKFSADEG